MLQHRPTKGLYVNNTIHFCKVRAGYGFLVDLISRFTNHISEPMKPVKIEVSNFVFVKFDLRIEGFNLLMNMEDVSLVALNVRN